MIIKSIEITSFGKFKNKTINFSDGLNIISGNNESGKSTVISFIYAMLYGFGDNRGKGLSMREKYTPWNGGECEGKLNILTSDGKNITIYRKAGNVKKYDILKVYDSDTAGEISLSPEDIIGISSDTFLKTVCIKQLSSAFEGSSGEIVTKLSNIAKSGDESADFEKAMKILETAKREIRPLRGNGGSLSQVNSEISSLERAKAVQGDIRTQLDRYTAMLSSAKNEAEKAEELYENALKESFDAPIANISGRISEKEAFISANHKKASFFKIYILASMVFAILSLALFFTNTKLWFLPLIATVVCAVMGFFEKSGDKTPSETKKLEELKAELSSLNEKKLLHEKKLVTLKNNSISAKNNLDSINMRLSSLESQIEFVDTSALPGLYQKRTSLENSLKILTLTSDALENSHKKMQLDFTPALNKKASDYLSFLTDGKYSRLFSDEDFNLRIEADIPRESSFFSGGTVDQLYLSLRLSLTDMIFKDEQSFIILDQPFLQYDKLRTKKAIELFESMADKRQILLFTADSDEFSDNKNTEILT